MDLTPHEKTLQQIRNFFAAKFSAPSSASQVTDDLKEVLESPILKQHIFANNILTVIDHGAYCYRYMSRNIHDVLGIEASTFLEKGLDYTFKELWLQEDAESLFPIFEKLALVVAALPMESRLHVRLNYDYRFRTPKGVVRLYQQTIPLALNELGFPYLVLGVVSDISEYKKSEGVHYRATLNIPGQPIKVLFSGNTRETAAPLTDREKEIVQHLADGSDANEIADKLFISEGTVRTHRKNILEKTGARNSVHLVRMAVANGWV